VRGVKWLSIIAFCVSIISLLGVVLFHSNGRFTLLYDILLATLGSALLGFIMSLVEYLDVKRTAMEVFYNEAMKAISVLGRAKYFFTDAPIDLVINCIAEELSNKESEQMGAQPKRENKDKLIENYRKGFPPEIVNAPDFNQKIEIWYTAKMGVYHGEMEKCFDSYIEISEMQLGELDNAYGNLNFIFANTTLRKLAYEQIYKPVKKQRKSALQQAYHFQMNKSGEGNLAACASFLSQLNNEWFYKKSIDGEKIFVVSIYRKGHDELLDRLEEFRCKIYKQKFEPEKHNPIISRIYSYEHPNNPLNIEHQE
jgi:hypothetical protein